MVRWVRVASSVLGREKRKWLKSAGVRRKERGVFGRGVRRRRAVRQEGGGDFEDAAGVFDGVERQDGGEREEGVARPDGDEQREGEVAPGGSAVARDRCDDGKGGDEVEE
jgi:hypothetical protein